MEKKRDFSLKSLAISKPSNNTPKNSQFKEEKLKSNT